MAQFTLLLLLVISLPFIPTVCSGAASTSSTSNFIKSSCKVTRYPTLCIKSLSYYENAIQESPKQIAQTALLVSLVKARYAKTFVIKMSRSQGLKKKEYQVVEDCVDQMGESVDRLLQSVGELVHMREVNQESFIWHMGNVQTWVSAALTDATTCLDGFADRALDGKCKADIRLRVLNVAQVTSNALALINRYADKYQV